MFNVPVSLARIAFGYLITRAITAFGFGILSYASVELGLTFIQDEIQNLLLNNFPSQALNLLGIARFDLCLNLIFSAYMGLIAFRSLSIALGRK